MPDFNEADELNELRKRAAEEALAKPQPPRSISRERANYWAFRINQADDPMAASLIIGEFLRECGVQVEP